jgi:hypothetical protein
VKRASGVAKKVPASVRQGRSGQTGDVPVEAGCWRNRIDARAYGSWWSPLRSDFNAGETQMALAAAIDMRGRPGCLPMLSGLRGRTGWDCGVRVGSWRIGFIGQDGGR